MGPGASVKFSIGTTTWASTKVLAGRCSTTRPTRLAVTVTSPLRGPCAHASTPAPSPGTLIEIETWSIGTAVSVPMNCQLSSPTSAPALMAPSTV